MRLVFGLFVTSFLFGADQAQKPAPAPAPAPAAAKPAAATPAPAAAPAKEAEKKETAAPAPAAAAPAPAPEKAARPSSKLSSVKTVYILQMQNGMDQFLASRLTSMKVFEVVTDPKQADAVITDTVGAGFQEQMKELYPPESEKSEKDEKKADNSSNDVKEIGAKRPVSTFSRGHGASVFVVDPKTSSVLWSIYMPPKNSRRVEVEQTSRRIAQAMADEIYPKKKNALTWLTK